MANISSRAATSHDRIWNLTHGYVYSSADAGVTWHRTLLDDATAWVTEESCTYGSDGQAYFADGESDTSTGQPRHEWGHLQLFRSTDHGMSWTRGGTRREGWVDWTYLAALPADANHSASLVVFGNQATDRLGHWWKQQPITLEAANGAGSISGCRRAALQEPLRCLFRWIGRVA